MTDHRKRIADEHRETEVLAVRVAGGIADRAGIAGDENRLVTGKHGLHVIEEVGSLRQRSLTVLEVRGTSEAGGAGHLLEAQDVGTAAG